MTGIQSLCTKYTVIYRHTTNIGKCVYFGRETKVGMNIDLHKREVKSEWEFQGVGQRNIKGCQVWGNWNGAGETQADNIKP